MNDIPKPWQIEHYKKAYPPGTRIELTADMFEENIPAGTKGTVVAVDDIGSIHMAWDNGRSLAVIPEVDSFKKTDDMPPAKQATLKHQKNNHGRSR